MSGKINKNKELILYFFLAFTTTWSFSAILILSKFEIIKPVPAWLHSFTAYGPIISAFLITYIFRGTPGIKSLFSGIIKWKIGFWWLAFSALSIIFIFIISAFIVFLITGETINWSLIGKLENLPNYGILAAYLFALFNSGIGEETGWRGFALPRLQKSFNAFQSTIILSIIWAFWHLPFFFYMPDFTRWGIASFPGAIIALIIGGLILTWIYNSTRGSILAVALWHSSYDLLGTKGAPELVPVLVVIVILVFGLLIPFIFKSENLSTQERQKI